MNVLVVEDDRNANALLQRILTKGGHRVLTAANGVEALAVLQREAVDAIITDIMMPQMDGFRLCQTVRQDDRFKSIPLIVYTANYSSPADEKLAIDLGADVFLRKPAAAETIRETVRRVAGQPSAARPRPADTSIPEPEILQLYSDRLMAKLEERNLELALANESLRDSEERFAKVFQASPVPLNVSTVKEGRLLMVNDRFCQFFGYTREEVVGRTVLELELYADADQRARLIELLLSKGAVRDYEVRLRCKDGTVREALVVMDLFHYPGVSEPALISMFTDITERKRAAAALVQAEKKYRAIFDHAVDGIFQTTPEGRYLTANPALARLFGYASPEALMAERTDIARQGFADPGTREEFKRLVAEHNSVSGFEYEALRKDGSRVWVSESARAVRDELGYIVCFEGSIKDISLRKRAELSLARASELLERTGEIAQIGGWELDLRTMKVFWSLETCRIHEVDPPVAPPLEQAINFYAPDARPIIQAAVQAGIDRGTPWDLELPLLTAKGRLIWVRAQGSPVMKDGKAIKLHGAFQDITERRQLEAQLRESQKMEAIGQLAGGIAHDFNNILGAILGNAELVKVMPAGSREAGECLDSIVTASRRAGDLVQQILAFSRRQDQKRQPLQLHLIVREALKLLRATVPAAIEFKTSVAISPTVLADPTQIHSVTMNLCTNAWHAMKERHGTLTVELAETEVDESFARVHPDLRPGRYVRLTVTDTGAGMDADTLQHIFEPFFTTKLVGEGTGLGLAVVHGIMKNHDGGIVVRSQPGRGTTFALYFPVFEAEVVEVPATTVPIPSGRGEHVLFVDDEEPLVRIGAAALGRLSYRVTARTSPVEALALFKERPAEYDLVVTDLNMPSLSGIEFARKLLAIRPDARLVLTTGFSATVNEEVAREVGFRALLPKPYDLRSLGETVQQVLGENTRRP